MGRPKGFSRNEVLESASQLFRRKGYADTSLLELEKVTGVNKSGLYSEFKDKDEIFTECLKSYASSSGVLELLNREPLGRRNIEDFLLASQKTKGCFVVNSVREYSILPKSAKIFMASHIEGIRSALRKNLVNANPNMDPDLSVNLIATFNSGVALQLNAGEVKDLKEQVKVLLNSVFGS